MRHERVTDPILITDVAETPEQEFNRRRKKYAIMMASRALCVIGAALTYQVSIWLALAFIVGGAVLPWCAVLIANDRPAKSSRHSVQAFVSPPTGRALTDGSANSGSPLREHRVIENGA